MAQFEIETALSALPPPIRQAWPDIMTREGFAGAVTADEARRLAERAALTMPELMIALLPLASRFAVTPISGFAVGAIARGASTGNLYVGANMEFDGQALSFSVHAEQAAVNNAWIGGETGITALAVSAAPCGYCRQFLCETPDADKIAILLPGREQAPLAAFLPAAFGPRDLGVHNALMVPQSHGLACATADPVVAAALAAANASYAPYTQTHAGVAICVASGAVHAGRHAENAAFNPSLSPLQSALGIAHLRGADLSTITRCVLVTAPGKADQSDATRAVLASVAPDVTLEVITISSD